jgi:hypothetical protein
LLQIVKDEKIEGIDSKSTVKQIITAIHNYYNEQQKTSGEKPASSPKTPKSKARALDGRTRLKDK